MAVATNKIDSAVLDGVATVTLNDPPANTLEKRPPTFNGK